MSITSGDELNSSTGWFLLFFFLVLSLFYQAQGTGDLGIGWEVFILYLESGFVDSLCPMHCTI